MPEPMVSVQSTDFLPQSARPNLWNSENSQDISVSRQMHHGLNPASEYYPCISDPIE